MDTCKRCGNEAIIGGQTLLCSPCWWMVAAWPDCRLTLTEEEESALRREKELYGIRDMR